MNHWLIRLLPAALALMVLGCGPSLPPPQKIVQGPHNGITLLLPDDLGVVEILNEPEVSDHRNPKPTSIVLYFLKDDGKTPLTSPSNVTMDVNAARGRSEKLALKPDPRTGDPFGSCRFVTPTGPYMLDGLRGQLFARIDGRQVSLPFQGR